MSDNPEDYELIHYGVKGMKWGVRKEERLQRSQRVASGNGSRGDKLRELGKTSGLEFARAGGSMQRVSENRAKKLGNQKAKAEQKQAQRQEKYGNANLLGRVTIDDLRTQVYHQERVRDGKGLMGMLGQVDRHTWGRNGAYDRYLNMQIDQAKADIEKIKAGKNLLDRSGFSRLY